jgi:hypothetical protein
VRDTSVPGQKSDNAGNLVAVDERLHSWSDPGQAVERGALPTTVSRVGGRSCRHPRSRHTIVRSVFAEAPHSGQLRSPGSLAGPANFRIARSDNPEKHSHEEARLTFRVARYRRGIRRGGGSRYPTWLVLIVRAQ